MDEFKDILIQRYLNNDLSGEELYAFEQTLNKDPALQESVHQYKLLIKTGLKQGFKN